MAGEGKSCPVCGQRVRTLFFRRLLGAAAGPGARVDHGRCRGGHELRRVHGTVVGPWEQAGGEGG